MASCHSGPASPAVNPSSPLSGLRLAGCASNRIYNIPLILLAKMIIHNFFNITSEDDYAHLISFPKSNLFFCMSEPWSNGELPIGTSLCCRPLLHPLRAAAGGLRLQPQIGTAGGRRHAVVCWRTFAEAFSMDEGGLCRCLGPCARMTDAI
jgi:hypothetical protein